MNIVYGYYKLNVNCDQFDNLMDRMISRLMQNNTSVNGLPTQKYDDFQSAGPAGVVSPLTAVVDGSDRIVGLGFYENDMSRCWIVAANNGHAIFFDCLPTLVTHLGLSYDEKTKRVFDPVTNVEFLQLPEWS